MKTSTKVALAGAAVVGIGLVILTRSTTPVAYAGFWRPGAGGLWYPCGVAHPYLVYAQPDTNRASYQRFDYQALLVTTTATRLNQPSGQGANHDPMYTTNDGRQIPVFSTNRPAGYMPYPTVDMLNPQWHEGDPNYQDAGAYYKSKNPGVPYDSPTEEVYAIHIANTAEWSEGNIPAFQQAKLTQCAALPPTAVPPTVGPGTPTPVPPLCPTCPPVAATPTITPHIGPALTMTWTPHIGPAPTKTHTKIPIPTAKPPA